MAAPKLRFKEFDEDWLGLKIKDLVTSLDAGVSVNSEDIAPQEDEYSVLKTSCISSGYFDENERKRVLQDVEIQRLKEPVLDDSILMSRMNTPLLVGMNAYVFKAPQNTFLPDRLWQLKINDSKTVTRWLAFYLGSDQGLNQIRDLATGTSNSMKNITKPDVLNIDLFAPQKEEQTKIASFLSTVDNKISQLSQKHALLSQYKQGMMQKLFSQQIRFKADDGSEFGAWGNKRIQELFAEVKDKVLAQEIQTYSITAGKGFVSQAEKFGRDISGQQNSNYIVLKPQDLSYNKGNSKTYKYGCVYLNEFDYSIAVPNVFISFRAKNINEVDPKFYAKLFEYHYLDRHLRLLISSSARMDGLLNVSKDGFFEINLPYPCLEEQTKIANFLSAIDQKIEVVAQQIEQAKQWKKGLLQQMFV